MAARAAASRSPFRGPPKRGANDPLGAELGESIEALRAIRSGEVDAVLLAGKHGNQVFSLEGAEHAYRVLIESMNEGALTLTADNMILYANQCFARMVKMPLQQVVGKSFRRFLSPADRAAFRAVMRKGRPAGDKIQLRLNAGDGTQLPVQISIRPLGEKGLDEPTLGVIVTDLTEAHRSEEMLRALTHRVVQVQEAERGRIAAELHDNITQPLCAALFRSEALACSVSDDDKPVKKNAVKLRAMLGQTADAVERISRHLRPGTLEHLGLVEVLRDTIKDFAARTGVAIRLHGKELAARLPADTELALYRIVQEALKNVQTHARARRVSVSLKEHSAGIQLVIKDDGVGFDSAGHRKGGKKQNGLGVLGMRERASYVGGSFEIASQRGAGTQIKVRIVMTVAVSPVK